MQFSGRSAELAAIPLEFASSGDVGDDHRQHLLVNVHSCNPICHDSPLRVAESMQKLNPGRVTWLSRSLQRDPTTPIDSRSERHAQGSNRPTILTTSLS